MREWGSGWVPSELAWFQGKPVVSMIRLPSNRPLEPFFHQTVARAKADPQRPAPRLLFLDEVPDEVRQYEPSGFLFHMARCGSTLVSQMLAALPRHRVLSEPMLFYSLLAQPEIDEQDRRLWLRALLGLYAQGFCGNGEALFIKWSSAFTQYVRLLEELYPQVPKVFLFRDPVEVLVALAEGRDEERMRFTDAQLAPHLRLGSMEAFQRLPFWEQAARYLASCCYWASESKELPLLEYTRLPAAAWEELADHFRIRLGMEEVREFQELSLFYSKKPDTKQIFRSDAVTKRQRASTEIRDAVERLVTPELTRLQERHRSL